MANLTGMDAAARMRGVQYKNRWYGWNGRNRMRKHDGISWNFAGIQKTAFTPTVAATTGSLSGTYNYYVVPVNSKHYDPFGNVVSGIPSTISAAITVAAQGATVGGIPATHADPQVDKWYIYRNRSGYYDTNLEDEAQDFYYVGSAAIGATTFTDDTVTDDQLQGLEIMRFDRNIPPSFKHGALYGERLFGLGFDPYTTGTVSSSGATLTFGGGALIPDGFVGCVFQASGSAKRYIVKTVDSATQITLEDSYAETALVASAFKIFRDPWDIYFSEFTDLEGWGPASEFYRWKRQLPGQAHGTGCITFGGQLLIFTATDIYAIYGKGQDVESIKITPEPLYRGLGAVSGDSICRIGEDVYFMSLQGPCVLSPGQSPELIGQTLNTDWLDVLTQVEQAIICAYGENNNVWFWVPRTGETSNSRGFRYELLDKSWWEEAGAHPVFGLIDDGDNGVQGKAHFVQDRFVFQPDYGSTDMVPTSGTSYSGTVTTGGTLGFTDSTATFPTSGGKLEQCYVRIYRGTGESEVLVGTRRLTTNAATTVTWVTGSGTGNGALTVNVGDRYEIGSLDWTWLTKTYEYPAHKKVEREMHLGFNTVDSSGAQTVRIDEYFQGTLVSKPKIANNKQLGVKFGTNMGNFDYKAKLESRADAVVRQIVLITDVSRGVT